MIPIAALSFVVAVLICLITTFILWHLLRKKKSSILILGICDSGKTTLFTKLVHNVFLTSYTSLKENIGSISTDEVLKIVDVPGHDKLRSKYIEQYKREARACIFMIDSKNIQSELKDVAEYLYNILTDPQLSNGRSKLLIVCNKQDALSAKGSVVVKSLLEKELNTLTVTKIGALAGLDQSSKATATLTKPGSTFAFDKSRCSVEFVECSTHTDATCIEKWLKIV